MLTAKTAGNDDIVETLTHAEHAHHQSMEACFLRRCIVFGIQKSSGGVKINVMQYFQRKINHRARSCVRLPRLRNFADNKIKKYYFAKFIIPTQSMTKWSKC